MPLSDAEIQAIASESAYYRFTERAPRFEFYGRYVFDRVDGRGTLIVTLTYDEVAAETEAGALRTSLERRASAGRAEDTRTAALYAQWRAEDAAKAAKRKRRRKISGQ
jgi:hypothetical protein